MMHVRRTRSRMEPLRWLGWVALGMVLMFLAMFLVKRWNAPLTVDTISIAYPYNERSLVVKRSGSAELSNRGETLTVRRGYFDVDDLFQELMFYWEPLREGDTQNMGTVRIFFNNDTSGTYFIYDTVYLDSVFASAQSNVVGDPSPP